MSYLGATCWRCGVTNETRDPRGYLCQTCKHMLDISPTEKDALEPGKWVRVGLVWRWQSAFAESPTTQRRTWRRIPRPLLPVSELVPCGTQSAYARHKRRGEEVDPACLTAAREYKAEWMRRRRAQQREEAA